MEGWSKGRIIYFPCWVLVKLCWDQNIFIKYLDSSKREPENAKYFSQQHWVSQISVLPWGFALCKCLIGMNCFFFIYSLTLLPQMLFSWYFSNNWWPFTHFSKSRQNNTPFNFASINIFLTNGMCISNCCNKCTEFWVISIHCAVGHSEWWNRCKFNGKKQCRVDSWWENLERVQINNLWYKKCSLNAREC